MEPAHDIPIGERVLTVRRTRHVVPMAASVAVVGAGVVLLARRSSTGIFVVLIGLFCVAVVGRLLISPPRLELDADGFTSVTLGAPWRVEWNECSEFAVRTVQTMMSRQKTVVFDWSAHRPRQHLLSGMTSRITRSSTRQNSELPDTYGMKAADLVDLLNDCRSRATR